MNIAVIGTGYVGVVTAAVMAQLGHRVYGLDVDRAKIDLLRQGKAPFFEPGLELLIAKGLKAKRLSFSTDYRTAVRPSRAVFICVGTPSLPDGSYNPQYVLAAARSMAPYLRDGTVVVIKSTVPPSTGEEVAAIINQFTKSQFYIASVPEFLREGSAIKDALSPARTVIGAEEPQARQMLLEIHRRLPGKKIICDIKSAQLVKYAANAFLATKISFINSLAIIADKIGADIDQVREGFGSDPRIGTSFLNPGLGYGGSCFPKDTHALIAFSSRLGYDFSFLKQVDKINDNQIIYFIDKINKLLGGNFTGKTAAVLGLAFKPDTDDLRESRAIVLVKQLVRKGMKVIAYDPAAMAGARPILPLSVQYAKNEYDCVRKADLLCLATEWPQFGKLDFGRIKKLMRQPNIADGRNFLPVEKLKEIGFHYAGIGRG